jgi:hypothetical protein
MANLKSDLRPVVASIKEALALCAEGKLDLSPVYVMKARDLRFAPLTRLGVKPPLPQALYAYTLRALSVHLGMTEKDRRGGFRANKDFNAAFRLLELREAGEISDETFFEVIEGEHSLPVNKIRELTKVSAI